MMRFREMFCVVVGVVGGTRAPVVPELLPVGAVPHPPVLHVHQLSCFGLQIFADETEGRSVVGLNRCRWLLVSQ